MATESTLMSLRDLMRHHRELFVLPLFWTSHHLNLVGCRFETVDTPNTISTTDQHTQDDTKISPSSQRDLPLHRDPLWLINTIANSGNYPFDEYRTGPAFHFANTPIHRPDYIIFIRCNQTEAELQAGSPPIIGYFDYTSVELRRQARYQPWPDPSGRPNSIGERICERSLAAITPVEWTEDPYFVCLLVALAQVQEKRVQEVRGSGFMARLFVVNPLDKEYVHLYEARVSKELLGALREPSEEKRYVEWPVVVHRRVAYMPEESFMDRLVEELVVARSRGGMGNGVGGRGCAVKRPYTPESDGPQKTRRLWWYHA